MEQKQWSVQMAVNIYLLSLEEILGTDKTERFVRTALKHVDEERARKAEAIKSMDGKAVSLGAGLLLQRMMADYRDGCRFEGAIGNPVYDGKIYDGKTYRGKEDNDKSDSCKEAEICRVTVDELYDYPSPLQLRYSYGPHGKPKILDFSLQFSLSHSGQYILCAVSSQNVGADIQQKKKVNALGIAKRFFSPEEYLQLEQCGCETECQELFYRMWTRKEAYGKLTGDGVPSLLRQDVSQIMKGYSHVVPPDHGLKWITVQPPMGYEVAVCTDKLE